MMIPSVPDAPIIGRGGKLSDIWRVYFTQLTNQLQGNVSDEGYLVPFQSQDNQTVLNQQANEGGLIYDEDSSGMRANINVLRGTIGNFSDSYEYSLLNSYHEMTEDEINAIPSGERNGKFLYDTTNDVLKVGFNDTIKTVTTT